VISTDDSQTTHGSPSRAGRVGATSTSASGIRAGKPPRILSEFEKLLSEPGCPTCRHVAETERSFFSWFEIESHTTAEVHAQLRAAMGLCPAHERRLIEDLGQGPVMTIVMREALAGARLALRGEGQIGRCPACASDGFSTRHGRTLLVDGLRDPALARLYAEHDGVCLPHILDTLPETDPATVKMLAERLLASLHDRNGPALVALLAGADADAPRRAMWRARLPQVSTAGATLDGLDERLEIEACPVCFAAGLAGRDYQHWFLARAAENDPSLATDPGELCSVHLHDVALADPPVAFKHAVDRKRKVRIVQLERFLGRLPRAPMPQRRRRRGGQDTLETIGDELLALPHCSACHARDGVERAQQELVVLSLGLAAARDRYERGHGLCVRHARQVVDGSAARVARHHADARVALLAWEVQETARKYAWAFRHEACGAEHDGWLRGMAQIDGRVFEGGPAPIGEHENRAANTRRGKAAVTGTAEPEQAAGRSGESGRDQQ
jgi:hypothetical protein